MSWKECSVMDEKLKFITQYLESETITSLCKEFDVSRTTGHGLIKRYREMGSEASLLKIEHLKDTLTNSQYKLKP